jgi:Guanylate kinase
LDRDRSLGGFIEAKDLNAIKLFGKKPKNKALSCEPDYRNLSELGRGFCDRPCYRSTIECGRFGDDRLFPCRSMDATLTNSSSRLIILTGPSRVGKGTLLDTLRAAHPEINLSISATIRDPRPGNYYFYDQDRFEQAIAQWRVIKANWRRFVGFIKKISFKATKAAK